MNSEEIVKPQVDVLEDTDTQLDDASLEADDASLETVVGGSASYDPNGQPSRWTMPFQD